MTQKELEEMREKTRTYKGNGKYEKEKRDRKYIGDRRYLNKCYNKGIARKLSIENKK